MYIYIYIYTHIHICATYSYIIPFEGLFSDQGVACTACLSVPLYSLYIPLVFPHTTPSLYLFRERQVPLGACRELKFSDEFLVMYKHIYIYIYMC